MGVQENKNQHNGEAISKKMTRLLRAIRMEKAKEIRALFERKAAEARAQQRAEEDSESEDEEDSESEDEQEQAPSGRSPASLAPPPARPNILNQIAQIRNAQGAVVPVAAPPVVAPVVEQEQPEEEEQEESEATPAAAAVPAPSGLSGSELLDRLADLVHLERFYDEALLERIQELLA